MKELGARDDLSSKDIMHYVVKGIQDNKFNKAILHSAASLSDMKKKCFKKL